MLSEKEIKALKAGAYGVTRNGNKVRVINVLDNDVALVAVKKSSWEFENYANFPYYHSFGSNSDLDIVRLWEDKPEQFDLERALAGEPLLELETNKKCYLVKSINNEKAYILERDDGLLGYVYDEPNYFVDNFIMWKELAQPSADDLPKPIREFGDLEEVWYVQKYENQYKPYSSNKKDHWVDQQEQSLNNGCYYATEEDCKKVCDWLMNR